MFESKYLPVDIGRNTAAIYTERMIYPADKLEAAYKYLEGSENVPNVIYDKGTITFTDDTDIKWTLPEIIAAYEYYKIAVEQNFTYFKVSDETGSVHLFVSREFNKRRILVDAFTYRSVIVYKEVLREKIASIIDRCLSHDTATKLFKGIVDIEDNNHQYLEALITYRGDPQRETFILSPILSPPTVPYTSFTSSDYAELVAIYNGDANDTTHYKISDNVIINKLDLTEAYLLKDFAYIKRLHESVYNSKSNYTEVFLDETGEPAMYISTNFRYVVEATTFRICTLRNQSAIQMTKYYAGKRYISGQNLNSFWELMELSDVNK